MVVAEFALCVRAAGGDDALFDDEEQPAASRGTASARIPISGRFARMESSWMTAVVLGLSGRNGFRPAIRGIARSRPGFFTKTPREGPGRIRSHAAGDDQALRSVEQDRRAAR